MKKLLAILFVISIVYMPAICSEIEDDYLDIAGNYCVVGEYNSAMEYLDKILKLNPNNQRAADLKKGLTHIISGDKTSFIENVNPLIKQAMEYKKIGDEQAELKTLEQATQEKNAYLAYYYLGNFYAEKNDYKNAINAYNSSSSARTDFAPPYLSSAVILYNIGKFESALNSIDKYLSICPNDDLAYAVKSRIEFSLGHINLAKGDNEKAISLSDCPEYQFDRGKILYMEGKYTEAKELFTKLLPQIQTTKIYEYMGLCDYANEDYTKALMNFDKAILLSNDDEYLENKYNEIKQLLENKQNGEIQN